MAIYLFKVFSKARNSRLMALVGFLKALPQQCQCTMACSYLNAHKKKKKCLLTATATNKMEIRQPDSGADFGRDYVRTT